MAATGSRTPHRITQADFNLAELITFVDIVYGAVLGYGFFLVADALKPLFLKSPVDWSAVLLLTFTTNFLVGDYIEARLYTRVFPYKGRRRVTLDLLIAMTLFVVYVACPTESPMILMPLGVVFLLGGFWGITLEREYKGEVVCEYPKLICGTHFGAAILLVGGWAYLRHSSKLTVINAVVLWIGYLGWSLFIFTLKEAIGMPPVESDLISYFPVDSIARRFIQWTRRPDEV